MKALVVYDSVYGNTEQIAQAIAASLSCGTKAFRAGAVDAEIMLKNIDLLVVGSPTLGGRPMETVRAFLDTIPKAVARKLEAAAFDTRLTMKFAKLFGHAADRMEARMKANGCSLKSNREGFIVKGSNGPLAAGELERAGAWAMSMTSGAD